LQITYSPGNIVFQGESCVQWHDDLQLNGVNEVVEIDKCTILATSKTITIDIVPKTDRYFGRIPSLDYSNQEYGVQSLVFKTHFRAFKLPAGNLANTESYSLW